MEKEWKDQADWLTRPNRKKIFPSRTYYIWKQNKNDLTDQQVNNDYDNNSKPSIEDIINSNSLYFKSFYALPDTSVYLRKKLEQKDPDFYNKRKKIIDDIIQKNFKEDYDNDTFTVSEETEQYAGEYISGDETSHSKPQQEITTTN